MKLPRKLTVSPMIALACGATAIFASSTQAQTLFSSDLDTSTGFTVLGTADTASTFGYDYSADGIPSAPNGTGTTGLKLEANLVTPTGAEEIAAVTDTTYSAPLYTVTVDAWVNANGSFPGGGAGSTEFAGIGIGHDGTTAGRNGGSFIYNGEGGSSLADYRLYKDGTFQDIASTQYNVADINVDGIADSDIELAFPGVAPPVSQSQTGVPNDGSGGFQWMTITATVDTVAGTVNYTITSDDAGATIDIGTIDTNIGSAFATTGAASILYADIFSSVSGTPAQSFGVFDNFSVFEIPEPTTAALLGLGGLALLRRRSAA